ncbi:MAG: hypothetical protein R3F59_15700 [Myxococcota bacterium]
MADVIFGGTVRFMLQFGMLEAKPAFTAYSERLAARPALQAADARNAGEIEAHGLALGSSRREAAQRLRARASPPVPSPAPLPVSARPVLVGVDGLGLVGSLRCRCPDRRGAEVRHLGVVRPATLTASTA